MSLTSLVAKAAAWAVPFGAGFGFVASQAVPPPAFQLLLRDGWTPLSLGLLQWVGCTVLFMAIGALISAMAARQDRIATKRSAKYRAETAAGFAMRCTNCRREISNQALACPKCGHPGGGNWLPG